ncbi:MAG TPA: hypothetical protein ENO21_04180 [Firmicutes bacterium]|nr:hypothetical protein [Bacillota bacterium]
MAIELVAEPRAELGKEQAKKLRADNRLPGNVYGPGLPESRAISFNLHETEKTIKDHGRDAEYELVLEGQKYPVRIQDIELEPIYKDFLHIDLLVKGNG